MLENGNVYISKREPKYAFLLAFMFTQDKKNSHRFIIPLVIIIYLVLLYHIILYILSVLPMFLGRKYSAVRCKLIE